MATKKAPAKKAPGKKVPGKKVPGKKASGKKVAAKRVAATKAPEKKSKALARLAKAPARRAPAKKAKAPARKAKVPTKRAPAKTAPPKQAPAEKGVSSTKYGFAITAFVKKAGVDVDGIAALRRAVRATNTPIHVVRDPDKYGGEAGIHSWDRQLIDAAVVEALLDEGAPIHLPAGEPETYAFWLHQWCARDALAEDSLEKVIAHPFFGRVLVNSFLPTRETKTKAGDWLEHAAKYDSFGPVFSALEQRVVALVERWTLGALDVHGGWLESLCRPSILRRAPRIADAVRGLQAWRLLQRQLRAGIMDEWGWTAQDEAIARLGGKPAWGSSGPAPYVVYFEKERHRVVAFGPDGVVFDEPYTPASQDIRTLLYVDGDVLACAYPRPATWIKSGGTIDADPYGFFLTGTGDGKPLANTLRRVERGATDIGAKSGKYDHIWFDGTTHYALASLGRIRADGTAVDDRGELVAFDPETGSRRPTQLPVWFRSKLTTPDSALLTELQQSHMLAVPPGAEASPLGARDGLGATAVFQRDHALHVEGIDGRSRSGWVNGQIVVGLMTFPEREGFYPIIEAGFELGVAMPDGTTPLVPLDQLFRGRYWGGGPSVPLVQWYSLRPRDPAASRALATCSDDAAKALVAASSTAEPVHDEVMDYGNMQAVLVAREPVVTTGVEKRAAVTRALPAVTHPGIADGIVHLAAHAAASEQTLARMRTRLASALAPRVVESTFHNKDASSLAVLLEHGMHWWVEDLGKQLGQQILDVSRYLFVDDSDEPRTPAATTFPWHELLRVGGEVLYRTLACATPKQHREQFAGLLAMWRDAELCTHLSSVRVAVMALPEKSPALAGLDRKAPDRLATLGANRYFVRFRSIEGSRIVALVVEATRDGVFRVPDGGELREEHVVDTRIDRAAIDKTLALYTERTRVEYDAELVDLVARETGLSHGAAALAWGAGYDPWILGDKARARMQLSRTDLDLAELQLRGKRLREVYTRAMPVDPAEMFTAAGARQFADAWNAIYGKQTAFPSELVSGLRADLRDDTLPLSTDARILVAPDAAPYLTVDEAWVMRPTTGFDAGKRQFEGWLPAGWPLVATHDTVRNPDVDRWFHGYGIGRFARYAAWAYLALPGGDPIRASILRAAELVKKRLANPDLLLLAGVFDLSSASGVDLDALVEPLRANAYRAADAGAAAPGFDRGDVVVTWPEQKNGAFVAVRPAQITDLACTAAAVGVTRFGVQRTTQRLGPHEALGPSSFGEYLAWAAPGFQRMLADAATTPHGVYAGDPRGSDAHAAVRATHGLGELAAAHYLLRAIGVTESRIKAILGGDGSAELAKLAKLPAPDANAVHGLAPGEEPVFGRLLPLVPFAALWSAAV